MIASASRKFASITTILPRSICCTSPESSSPTLSVNSSRIRARSPSRTRWMMRCLAACTAVRPNASNGTSSSSTSPTWKAGSSNRASSSATCTPGSSTVSTTVRSTTMRIVPLSSSMPISARTLGPCRFTSAACRPSLSRSSSSVRSSCLVFVSSRIADTTSVVFAISSFLAPMLASRSPVHRQPRVADARQGHRPRLGAVGLQHHGPLVGHRHDSSAHPPEPRDGRLHLLANEPHPVAVPAQRPLEPRARYFEHVAAPERPVGVEPRLEDAARRGALRHAHAPGRELRPRRRGPLDAHLNERPMLRAADAEVGQLEPQRSQPGLKRVDEAVGEHKKKRGPNFARFTGRNLAARGRLSSEREPQVGDHASVAPARGAMREELRAVMRAALRRERDGCDPQGPPLLRQRGPEVHVPRSGLGAPAELAQHFRTYFIAIAANTYSTMHYDIARPHEPAPLHDLDAALHDASRRSPPSGMEQRDHLLLGCGEIHRNAIGDGDSE